MDDCCEMLENCPFFMGRTASPVMITDGWIRLYCNNREKAKRCARKRYFVEHGTRPPDRMTPGGTFL